VLLGNTQQRLWCITNGYALPSASGLAEIGQRLSALDESQRDVLRQALRIGLQLDTQVTHGQASQIVSQAYCSALPVAYSRHSPQLWVSFAVLVLEAVYLETTGRGFFQLSGGFCGCIRQQV